MIKESGAGSVPLTIGSGSGSRRPKKHTDPADPVPAPAPVRIRNSALKIACIGKIQAVFNSMTFFSIFPDFKKLLNSLVCGGYRYGKYTGPLKETDK
jgi:hypothetical protein